MTAKSQWDEAPLEQLRARGDSTLVGGPFGSELTQGDYVSEPGVPVIRGTNLGGKESRFVDEGFVFVSDHKATALRRNMAFPGDVIFTQRGTLGQVAVIPQNTRFPRYVISQSQMKLTPDPSKLDARFLYQYFRTPEALRRLLSQTQTTGVPHINLGILKRFTVPLPPLIDQQRIASLLDRADALRAKRRAALALLDTLTQSIFLDLFGDPVRNPKNLATVKLGELGEWQSGGTPPRDRSDYFVGDIPWFSSGELEEMTVLQSREAISPCALRETSAKHVPRGALMLGMYDSAALKASIAGVDGSCNQAVAFCSINAHLALTTFVYFAIVLGREHFRRLQRGVRQKNLNLSMVRAIEIPLPSLADQQRFAIRLAAVEKLKAAHRASLAELDALFASLQHRAFRGEL